MALHFHYDIVCPYAYLASTRIEAIAEEAGETVRWAPLLLGGLLKSLGTAVRPMDHMPEAKARLTTLDQLRRADQLGVPLSIPEAHPRRTVDAMRLLVAVDDTVRPALTRDLYAAYWVDGRDVADLDVLQALAALHGVDARATVADRAVRDELFDATREALDRGVFGVPTVRLGERSFWGVDRLHFVREALGLPVEPPSGEPGSEGTLELFHDVSSPFSYLAVTQARRLADEAGVPLTLTPILLGALFRDIGTPMVPLHTFSPPRQAWQRRDMREWARFWGVPFEFPSRFPLRTVTALRVLLQQPDATEVVYRAAWGEDRDVSDPLVLRTLLDAAGFDGQALVEGTRQPEVKERLKRNTARAEALGVCGVPTFLVGGEMLIWGQDRLDQVALALGGWRPDPPEERARLKVTP